ncbi:hypothetical protein ABEB36_010589 [Hypothenemus hampei]|uniref:Uncharacterized protein n=1 Tax=Hypothenemus hampei TaxID=57062 RepID=A0ABD1ECR8_HYPHA
MRKITHFDVAGIFNKAYSDIATIQTGMSGFRASGILPLNSSIFGEEDFLASDYLLGTGNDIVTVMNSSTVNLMDKNEPCKPGFEINVLPGTSTTSTEYCTSIWKCLLAKKMQSKSPASSATEEQDVENIFNDNNNDDISRTNEQECFICNEFGKNEMWFRCRGCGQWVRKDCSSADSADNYICECLFY